MENSMLQRQGAEKKSASSVGNSAMQMAKVVGNQAVVQMCGGDKSSDDTEEEQGGVGLFEIFGYEVEPEQTEDPEHKAEREKETPQISELEKAEYQARIKELIEKIDGFLDAKILHKICTETLYRGDKFAPTVGFVPKGKIDEDKVIHYIEHSCSNSTPGYLISTSRDIGICKGFDGVKYISTLTNVKIVDLDILNPELENYIAEANRVLSMCNIIGDIKNINRFNTLISQMNTSLAYSKAQKEVLVIGPIEQKYISKTVSRESGWVS